jgi:hypothetical protein
MPLLILVAATTIGGALLGATASVAGMILAGVGSLALAFGLAIVALAATFFPRITSILPEPQRQVPAWLFLSESRGTCAARWGLSLGVGLRTHMVTPALLVLVGCMVLLSSPITGLAAGAVYGLSRGVAIVSLASLQRRNDTVRAGAYPKPLSRLRAVLPLVGTVSVVACGAAALIPYR